MKSVEELKQEGIELKEVELMVTIDELKEYAAYCLKNEVKFNDWIRQLAHEALHK